MSRHSAPLRRARGEPMDLPLKKGVMVMNGRAISLVGLMGLALAVSSGTALAAAKECNGPLSGVLTGGGVVNNGDFCVLAGAHVSGGVRVNAGGVLIACGSSINGGIEANGAANLIIGAGADEEVPPANFVCPGNLISGGVHISNTGPGVLAPAPSISLERNMINGAVHLSGNQGPIVVSDDKISGGLFCAGNASDLDDEG